MNQFDISHLPSTFYRATTRALIFDDEDRLLICMNQDGDYEIPGGGIEHGETLEECIRRELEEELHAKLVSAAAIVFAYSTRSTEGVPVMRLGVHVSIEAGDLSPDDTIVACRYVTRDEFTQLDFTVSEGNVVDFAEVIWKSNEKME